MEGTRGAKPGERKTTHGHPAPCVIENSCFPPKACKEASLQRTVFQVQSRLPSIDGHFPSSRLHLPSQGHKHLNLYSLTSDSPSKLSPLFVYETRFCCVCTLVVEHTKTCLPLPRKCWDERLATTPHPEFSKNILQAPQEDSVPTSHCASGSPEKNCGPGQLTCPRQSKPHQLRWSPHKGSPGSSWKEQAAILGYKL